MSKQNATSWIDGLKFGPFHWMVIILTSLTLIFDGYDSQIVAYIMPKVLKEWHLTPVAAGSLASYGFMGLMVGAAVFGMMSDRIGRKKTLMTCIAVFSIFSGAAFFAPNFKVFVTLRFLAGLGMGGAMPICITLVSEYAPAKIRAKAVTTMFGGFTLGWAVAGLAAMGIIPSFGWRPVLLIGLLPLIMVPIIGIYLPESVRFLAGKKNFTEAIRNMRKIESMSGIAPRDWTPEDFAQPVQEKQSHLNALFGKGLGAMTVIVWVSYFFNLLVVYGLSSWLPSLLVKSGLSLVKSYSYGMLQAVGATVGGFILGTVMDKFGRKAGLSLFYFFGGFALWVLGYATSNTMLLLAGVATGIFIIGTQIAQHVITGEIYPTHVRSTGVGWALTIGRVGSIVGPLLGGLLQMGGFSFTQYFVIFSIPCFICGILVLFYKVNVKGEGLEKINEKMATTVEVIS